MTESQLTLAEQTRPIIGAAIEVHSILGPGFIESVYEEALCVELGLRDIPFQRQVPVSVRYKDVGVGSAFIDLIVDASVVVELKSVDALRPVHVAQLRSYLAATGATVGLLINFDVEYLKQGIKRLIRT